MSWTQPSVAEDRVSVQVVQRADASVRVSDALEICQELGVRMILKTAVLEESMLLFVGRSNSPYHVFGAVDGRS